MKHLVSACAALAVSAAAQQQITRYDFQNSLSAPTQTFAWSSDVWLSKAYQFAGPANDRALSLPLQWNSGGQMTFTVYPSYGQTLDFSHLQWFVNPNTAGVSDCVASETITANGVQIAYLSSIPQNTMIDIDLTGIAALQNRTQPVTFEFSFVGSPTGTSPHEISYLQLTGSPCDLELHTIAPVSLPTATTDYFQIIGAGFRDAQGQSNITQVKFGNTVLTEYVSGPFVAGSFEVWSQWKLRIRPPQCLPPGLYTIEVRSACDVKTMQVSLIDPTVPTISGETVHPAGHPQCITVHGGPPGPQILVMFVSPDNTPSVVPGLLDLGIGGGFSVIDTVIYVGQCGTFCYPVMPYKIGEYHFHQGVVWRADNLDLSLQLPTTGILATFLY